MGTEAETRSVRFRGCISRKESVECGELGVESSTETEENGVGVASDWSCTVGEGPEYAKAHEGEH